MYCIRLWCSGGGQLKRCVWAVGNNERHDAGLVLLYQGLVGVGGGAETKEVSWFFLVLRKI